jgi:tetratricopeptide (TPR) repeat protein
VTVWANDLSAGPNGDDSPVARFLWSDLAGHSRTAEATRVAAASLIGTFSPSDEAIGILKQAMETAANRTDRGNIELALCQAYAKAQRWAELLAAAKGLTASYAVADKSFGYVAQARMGLKQWADLEQDARAELKTAPENVRALRTAALAMMRAGKPDKATVYIDRLGKLQFAGKEEHDLEAWHAILVGKSDFKLAEQLERDRGPSDADSGVEYTLGFLRVFSGKAEESQRSLAAALELDDWTLLDARAWVLQGKIQEQYGNADAAKAAYAESKKRPIDGDEPEWALRLIPAEPKP